MTSKQIKNIQNVVHSTRRCSLVLPQTSQGPCYSNYINRNELNQTLGDSFNYFSPRVKNQISRISLVSSPQKFATAKQIKMQTVTSGRLIDIGRRVTLPLHRPLIIQASSKGLPISPSKQKTQIKFIYQNNFQSSQVSNLKSNFDDSCVFLFKSKTERIIPKQKMIEYKISRNKICSAVFSYQYQPLSSIRRKSQELEKLLQELKREADLLSSRVSSNCDLTKEGKTSAAETTTSAMQEIKVSQSSLDSSRWSHSANKCKFQAGYNLYRPSLADKIPSSKHLGKTIILNNSTSYDFGGLMTASKQQIKQSQVQIKSKQQSLPRQWEQLKGLLSENNEQNMKESIHCGPDIRANSFNCEMLQSFGRAIKQSTVSYQE